MMLPSLRRHAWIVPVALSLLGAWSAPTANAASATAPPALDDHTGMTGADDPAAPQAPAGPPPVGVLHDFSRPALSVPTGDWRKVSASVAAVPGMTGMPGGSPNMTGQSTGNMDTPPSNGHAGHSGNAGHSVQGDSR